MAKKNTSHFYSEMRLVEGFVSFLDNTRAGKFEIIPEMEAGFGRPDLILYTPPKFRTIRDIDALAKLNPRLSPLLSHTSSKTITSLETLAKAAGVTHSSARQIAKELTEISRLNYSKDMQVFELDPIKVPPFSPLVSIEAKLNDWKRALVQAYRYLQFSNESWVLIDHAHCLNASKHINLFSSYGIGLASFSTNGQLYIHNRARTIDWPNTPVAWRAQALLARSFRFS